MSIVIEKENTNTDKAYIMKWKIFNLELRMVIYQIGFILSSKEE